MGFSSPSNLMVIGGCIIVMEIVYRMDFSSIGFLVCAVILGLVLFVIHTCAGNASATKARQIIVEFFKIAKCASYSLHPQKTPRKEQTISSSSRFSHISSSENQDPPNHHLSGVQFIKGQKLLSELSTWGIGGPCNHFTQVFNQTQLVQVISYCNEHSLRFMIIGKGSNCLFDDLGYDGCVILNKINFLEISEEQAGVYRFGSGYPFNRLGLLTANEGFTGLEFAAGIPGTVGGAVYMNAGANGQETADTIESIEIVTTKGECRMLNRNKLTFGYRSSPFQDMKDLAAITVVTFRLELSELASKTQREYLKRRKISQPIGQRSAGSVFRNPPDLGVSAAELIERAGMKGFRVGGAMVSEKHANFFINCGGSTSHDMRELISFVKSTVYQKFHIELKEEVLYVPPS